MFECSEDLLCGVCLEVHIFMIRRVAFCLLSVSVCVCMCDC